jgi:hypothetical protein
MCTNMPVCLIVWEMCTNMPVCLVVWEMCMEFYWRSWKEEINWDRRRLVDNIKMKLELLTLSYTVSHKLSPAAYKYKSVCAVKNYRHVKHSSVVKRPRHDVNHSPASGVKVKNAWNWTSIPPGFFMIRRLVSIGTNFPLPYYIVAISLKKCNVRQYRR